MASPRGNSTSGQHEDSRIPAAERQRRRREIWISAVALVAIAITVTAEQWITTPRHALSQGGGALFLLLNALNVFLIFLLVYLVARNLVKLVFERRSGTLGAHLNLKFVLAFGILATVPTAVLFLVSSAIVSQSIDTWFSLQIDRTFDESQRVADLYYRAAGDRALRFGSRIARQIEQEDLLRDRRRERLRALVADRQRDYELGVVQIFSAEGKELVAAINPEIPATHFSSATSDLVAGALAGEPVTQVDAATGQAVVRSAVPIAPSAGAGGAAGVVVVNVFTPAALGASLQSIEGAHEEYRRLQPQAGHIARAYKLELLLFALVVLLFAAWWGFRMAKGVTTPIRALAEGTAEVARGNLDVVVRAESDDEIGLLVESFNRMTGDLREARAGLEQTNAELERRRTYMEIVLRNTGAGVLSLDAEGRINTINPSAQRLLGVPPGAGVVGAKLEAVLVEPEQREILELAGSLQVGLRESIRRQVELPQRDDVFTLLVTVTLLKDEDGHVLGRVIVLDDYSQLVKVQRMEAWQEVARRIAHEIKNPLTPIQLSAQRLRRRFRPDERRPEDTRVFDECVAAITGQVEGLKLLVNEFSNFARLPAANPRRADLNQEVLTAAGRYAGTEGVAIKTDLDPGLPAVEIDTEQIGRLLTNLIDNALSAIAQRGEQDPTYQGGTVILRTVYETPLRAVRLEVLDDGVGVPPQDRRRIFEPYFSTKDHGTGLGLAIVSRIVADHRGYLRVQEAQPSGTRFVVEIPVPPASDRPSGSALTS